MAKKIATLPAATVETRLGAALATAAPMGAEETLDLDTSELFADIEDDAAAAEDEVEDFFTSKG